MPITTYEPDPNRLAPGKGADALWESIRLDRPLPRTQRAAIIKASDPTSGQSTTGARTGGTRSDAGSFDADQNGLCA